MGIKIDVAANSDAANKNLQNIEKSLKNIETTANRTSSSVGNLAKNLALGFAGLSSLNFIKTSVDTFTLLENKIALTTERSYQLLAVQKELFNVAVLTRSTIASTTTVYSSLNRALLKTGANFEKVLKATTAVQDSISISGSSIEASNAALVQFSQGLSSGVLRGEELNSVLEQTPRLAKALADGLSVNIGQLRKLGEQGQLTSEKVFESLISQADVLRKEFATTIPTIAQAGSTLSESIRFFVYQFAKGLGLSGSISEVISGIAIQLRNAGDFAFDIGFKLSEGIAAARRNAALFYREILKPILAIKSGVIKTIFEALPKDFAIDFTAKDSFKTIFAEFDRALGGMLPTITRVKRFFTDVFTSTSSFEDALIDVGRALYVVNGGFDLYTVKEFFNLKRLKDFGSALRTLAVETKGLTESIAARFSRSINIISYYFARASRILGLSKSAFNVSVGTVDALFTSLADVVRVLTDTRVKIYQLGTLLKFKVSSGFSLFLSALVDGFLQLPIIVGRAVAAAIRGLKAFIPQLIDALSSILSATFQSPISAFATDVINSMEDAYDHVIAFVFGVNTVTSKIGRALDYIKEFARNVVKAFFMIYDEVIGHSWWTDTINAVVDTSNNLWNTAGKGITKFATRTIDLFKDIWKTLTPGRFGLFAETFSGGIRLNYLKVIKYDLKAIFAILAGVYKVTKFFVKSGFKDPVGFFKILKTSSKFIWALIKDAAWMFGKEIIATFTYLEYAILGRWGGLIDKIASYGTRLWELTAPGIQSFTQNVSKAIGKVYDSLENKFAQLPSLKLKDFSLENITDKPLVRLREAIVESVSGAFGDAAILGLQALVVALGILTAKLVVPSEVFVKFFKTAFVFEGFKFTTLLVEDLGKKLGDASVLGGLFQNIGVLFTKYFVDFGVSLPKYISGIFQGIASFAVGALGALPATLGSVFKALFSITDLFKATNLTVIGGLVYLLFGTTSVPKFIASLGSVGKGISDILNKIKVLFLRNAPSSGAGIIETFLMGTVGIYRVTALLGLLGTFQGYFDSVFMDSELLKIIASGGFLYVFLYGEQGFQALKSFVGQNILSPLKNSLFGLIKTIGQTISKGSPELQKLFFGPDFWTQRVKDFTTSFFKPVNDKIVNYLAPRFAAAFNITKGFLFGNDPGETFRKIKKDYLNLIKELQSSFVLGITYMGSVLRKKISDLFSRKTKAGIPIAIDINTLSSSQKLFFNISNSIKDLFTTAAQRFGTMSREIIGGVSKLVGSVRSMATALVADVLIKAGDTGVIGKLMLGKFGKVLFFTMLGILTFFATTASAATDASGQLVKDSNSMKDPYSVSLLVAGLTAAVGLSFYFRKNIIDAFNRLTAKKKDIDVSVPKVDPATAILSRNRGLVVRNDVASTVVDQYGNVIVGGADSRAVATIPGNKSRRVSGGGFFQRMFDRNEGSGYSAAKRKATKVGGAAAVAGGAAAGAAAWFTMEDIVSTATVGLLAFQALQNSSLQIGTNILKFIRNLTLLKVSLGALAVVGVGILGTILFGKGDTILEKFKNLFGYISDIKHIREKEKYEKLISPENKAFAVANNLTTGLNFENVNFKATSTQSGAKLEKLLKSYDALLSQAVDEAELFGSASDATKDQLKNYERALKRATDKLEAESNGKLIDATSRLEKASETYETGIAWLFKQIREIGPSISNYLEKDATNTRYKDLLDKNDNNQIVNNYFTPNWLRRLQGRSSKQEENKMLLAQREAIKKQRDEELAAIEKKRQESYKARYDRLSPVDRDLARDVQNVAKLEFTDPELEKRLSAAFTNFEKLQGIVTDKSSNFFGFPSELDKNDVDLVALNLQRVLIQRLISEAFQYNNTKKSVKFFTDTLDELRQAYSNLGIEFSVNDIVAPNDATLTSLKLSVDYLKGLKNELDNVKSIGDKINIVVKIRTEEGNKNLAALAGQQVLNDSTLSIPERLNKAIPDADFTYNTAVPNSLSSDFKLLEFLKSPDAKKVITYTQGGTPITDGLVSALQDFQGKDIEEARKIANAFAKSPNTYLSEFERELQIRAARTSVDPSAFSGVAQKLGVSISEDFWRERSKDDKLQVAKLLSELSDLQSRYNAALASGLPTESLARSMAGVRGYISDIVKPLATYESLLQTVSREVSGINIFDIANDNDVVDFLDLGRKLQYFDSVIQEPGRLKSLDEFRDALRKQKEAADEAFETLVKRRTLDSVSTSLDAIGASSKRLQANFLDSSLLERAEELQVSSLRTQRNANKDPKSAIKTLAEIEKERARLQTVVAASTFEGKKSVINDIFGASFSGQLLSSLSDKLTSALKTSAVSFKQQLEDLSFEDFSNGFAKKLFDSVEKESKKVKLIEFVSTLAKDIKDAARGSLSGASDVLSNIFSGGGAPDQEALLRLGRSGSNFQEASAIASIKKFLSETPLTNELVTISNQLATTGKSAQEIFKELQESVERNNTPSVPGTERITIVGDSPRFVKSQIAEGLSKRESEERDRQRAKLSGLDRTRSVLEEANISVDTSRFRGASKAISDMFTSAVNDLEVALANASKFDADGKISQSAAENLDNAKARVNTIITRYFSDVGELTRQAAEGFADNVSSTVNSALKDLLKGKREDDKSMWKTFLKKLLDGITSSITDTFVDGLTNRLFDKRSGLSGKLESFGGGLFNLSGKAKIDTSNKTAISDELLTDTPTPKSDSSTGFLAGLADSFKSVLPQLAVFMTNPIQGIISLLFSLFVPQNVAAATTTTLLTSIVTELSLILAQVSIIATTMIANQFAGATKGAFDAGLALLASGGMVSGPGTGTSDSIPAMLSNGEFVVNAEASRKHLRLLTAINSGNVRKYASGGLVTASAVTASSGSRTAASSQQVFNINITGDISRQTRSEIYGMIPSIAAGVNSHNREKGFR